MQTTEAPHEHTHRFSVTVIATTAKRVEAESDEQIGTLKLAAMKEFGIPKEKANEYRLASSAGDPQAEFDDSKTVGHYQLHEGSKVYLVKPHNDA
jgi:hypothetical protein